MPLTLETVFRPSFFCVLLEFLGLFPPKKYRETAFPKNHQQKNRTTTFNTSKKVSPESNSIQLPCPPNVSATSLAVRPQLVLAFLVWRGEFCWRGSISNVDSNEFNESQKKKVPGMGRKEKTPTALKQMRFISFRCKGTQNKT